ncbi:MAG: glycosyltransferase [Sutterellaceae bacterium]|nr:glycosyltransferase [Burkholderiaceae bacterium]MDW8430930.1 glycosyltransferase [Sutterellaceae bacterium]
MPRHQIIGRLAARFPVVWLGPTPGWREYLRPGGPHFLAPDRFYAPTAGLDVYRPGWRHPLVYKPAALGRRFLRGRLAAARRRLIEDGATHIVLYLWRDEFADALDQVAHDASCYHVDDEYSFSEREVPNSEREVTLIRRVDQVIVHSPALLRKKGGINPHTALVPNGVDFEAFSRRHPMPPDLAVIPPPRVGYAGVIKKQLDLDLMVRLARARPHYSFVFVGPVMNAAGKREQLAALENLPNVFFLGPKRVEELPAYSQHFDVCLMCYEVNDYTNHIFPLKLNEYLATGRPVVAAPIESVRNLDVVTLATSDQEWLAAIDRHLNEGDAAAEAAARRIAFARAHDWNVLAERIARLIEGAVARNIPVAGQGGALGKAFVS